MKFVCKEVVDSLRAELKSVMKEPGVLCVGLSGTMMMLLWYVDSRDYPQ